MTTRLEAAAEAWAKKCVNERGNPHWHDLRDAKMEGFALAVEWLRNDKRRSGLPGGRFESTGNGFADYLEAKAKEPHE